MRRSQAPSQILKRNLEGDPALSRNGDRTNVNSKKRKHSGQSETNGSLLYRAPLSPLGNSQNSSSFTSHEDLIRKILAKPFKIPIPNYVSKRSVSLGIRRDGVRRSLHDPDEPDALVLYRPPELSAHEKLSVNSYRINERRHPKEIVAVYSVGGHPVMFVLATAKIGASSATTPSPAAYAEERTDVTPSGLPETSRSTVDDTSCSDCDYY